MDHHMPLLQEPATRKRFMDALIISVVCAACAATMLVVATHVDGQQSAEKVWLLSNTHILSSKERALFQKYQMSQLATSDSKPGNGWPYPNNPAYRLGPLGTTVYDSSPEKREELKTAIMSHFKPRRDLEGLYGQHQISYTDTNPPCFTQTDCHKMAVVNNLYEAPAPSLPVYDDDTMEMFSAMQKQDKMIADQLKDKEDRAKLGSKAPKLKPVICSNKCFARKGTWCCRL